MIQGRRNLFKSENHFICRHDVHQHFSARMSPFHILEQKNCFPNGCVTFEWKCKLLAKKKKCFRNFSYVGKECFNCRYFSEEKIHQFPEYVHAEKKYETFSSEYSDFKDWVQNLKSKRMKVEGIVRSVKPDLKLYRQTNRKNLSFKGFLIRFDEGFLDNTLFEDPFFLHISGNQQNHLLLRPDDNTEFEANLIIMRGRFEFIKASRFNFYERGESRATKRNDVIVGLNHYAIHADQPPKCLSCRNGLLTDIENSASGPRRAVVCMKGVKQYADCALFESETDEPEQPSCANDIYCHHAL